MSAHDFYRNVFFAAGQTSPEDAWSAGNYPASGSYVDVSAYEYTHVIVRMGAIHASDAPVITLKYATSTTGTLTSVSASTLTKTFLHTDDDQMNVMVLENAILPDNGHFLTLVVSGTVTNGTYGDILFACSDARHAPVTQTTALLPSDNYQVLVG